MSYQVHNSRRIPPRVPQPRKRKERDDGSEQQHQLGFRDPPPPSRSTTQQPAVSSNRLLAGYMAYEFITRGTLLGQDCSALPAEPRRGMQGVEAGVDEAVKVGSGEGAAQSSYTEVAALLKTEGAHIPGIVNPMQLARWIQM